MPPLGRIQAVHAVRSGLFATASIVLDPSFRRRAISLTDGVLIRHILVSKVSMIIKERGTASDDL